MWFYCVTMLMSFLVFASIGEGNCHSYRGEVITEGSIDHIIINKNHLMVIITITNKRHKINVTKLREHYKLCPKLIFTLMRHGIESFNRHLVLYTLNLTLVYIVKATTAYNESIIEDFCCSEDLNK